MTLTDRAAAKVAQAKADSKSEPIEMTQTDVSKFLKNLGVKSEDLGFNSPQADGSRGFSPQ